MKWLISIPIVLVALIVGISFYLQPNDFIGCSERPLDGSGKCESADAIVVVSGGDTPSRTAEGIRLFKNGWANSLVLAGAAKDKTGLSNAAAMRLQAISEGVPEDAIYLDEYSETTEQNAVNVQSIFDRHNFDKVILVTSGYHQQRANLEFKKTTDSVEILNHPVLNDRDWSIWWWTNPRGWWLAGGELVKIIALQVTGGTR